MKKNIAKLLVVSFVIFAASSAFAATATLAPGSTYSLGSTQPTVFKTSPKVTILTDLVAAAAPANTWLANSFHASGVGKSKGIMYATSSDDPGTYSRSLSADTAAPSAVEAVTATGFTQEK